MARTKFLRWDAGDQAAAQAYQSAINGWWSGEFPGESFSASWYPREDVDAKWVVPFLGPPAVRSDDGEEVVEPEGFADLHAGAELVDTVAWPPEEC